jgi:U3 small nucleolar RNA-associated protein 19
MPFLPPPAAAGKKRRREDQSEASDRAKTALQKASVTMDSQNEVDVLEVQIYESRKHYNNIVALISLAGPETAKERTRIAACVSLCRVYSKLLAAKSMTNSEGTSEEELIIIQWLRERYDEYTALLLQYLRGNAAEQNTAFTLLFQLVKQETNRENGMSDLNWKRGLFAKLVKAIIELPIKDHTASELLDKAKLFDDLRYHTFSVMA